MAQTKRAVPKQVREYLSDIGRRGGPIGGQMTKRLIELGRQKAEETGEIVEKTQPAMRRGRARRAA